MYRVGFGDCFLVSFPNKGATAHVLIDCGVHPNGKIGTLDLAVEDIARECGGRLAAIVATHEHADHISGFATSKDVFRKLDVGEVWMPWVLDPDDAVAAKYVKHRRSLAAALAERLAPASLGFGLVQNIATNATALDTLRGGLATNAKIRYLAAHDCLKDAAGIPGLEAHVLGPPRDESYLSRMNPRGPDRYITFSDGVRGGDSAPFADDYRLPSLDRALLPEAVEEQIRNAADGDEEALALSLDSVCNNTSVVVLFRIGGHTLLFPGDAQWGSWDWAWEHEQLASYMADLDFYKIGHHGSHNASQPRAIRGLSSKKAVAFMSTQKDPFPTIPAPKLVKDLDQHTRAWVRSDAVPATNADGQKVPLGKGLSAPDAKLFTTGAFWVDYVL